MAKKLLPKKPAGFQPFKDIADQDGEVSPHRLTLMLLTGCVVAFVLWSSLSHIEQQVSGYGSIVPSGQVKTVQHLEGGIITSILVAENQTVEAGQPLFNIRNQQAESDTQELQLQLQSVRLQIRRLEAERDDKPAPDFSDLAKDSRPREVENELQLFNARSQNYRDNMSILENQVRQRELKLDDQQNQLTNLQAELRVALEQYQINDRLRAAGAISETRYLQSKSAVQDFKTRAGSIEKSIPVTRVELTEAVNRMNELKQKHQSEVLDDLRKANLSLAQLEERVKTPEDKIRRTVVTSPIRGVINRVYMTTVGGVVKPGDRLVEIIPIDEKLMVEARIPTKDRGLIWEGLPALVKISAYDYALYGGIHGQLTEISPDTLSDERGNPYYRVRIQLSENKLGGKMQLFPGMTADVNILSGRITIMQYLLRPIWKISENALREAR